MELNRFDLCRQTRKARLLFPTTSRFEAVFQHFNYFWKQAPKPTSTRKRHQVCVDYATGPGFDNRVKQTQRHGRTDAFKWPSRGEEDRCLHVALPVAAFLEMLTKSVTTRATTATRAGCVQRGMGHTTPFSGRGNKNASEDDFRPNILQLNTEWLTEKKISIIEQLAYKNKAFIIVLQETHCTFADEILIPNFALTGSTLSRNHGLTTFVHERLEWSLVDQSPEQSETEWLCVDVAAYKIINVCKPLPSQLFPTTIP